MNKIDICAICNDLIYDNTLKCSICESTFHAHCKKRELRSGAKDLKYVCSDCSEVSSAHILHCLKSNFKCIEKIESRLSHLEESNEFIACNMKPILNYKNVVDQICDDVYKMTEKLNELAEFINFQFSNMDKTLHKINRSNTTVKDSLESIADASQIFENSSCQISKSICTPQDLSPITNGLSKCLSAVENINKIIMLPDKPVKIDVAVGPDEESMIDKLTQMDAGNKIPIDSVTVIDNEEILLNTTNSKSEIHPITSTGFADKSILENSDSQQECAIESILPVFKRKWVFVSRLEKSVLDENIKSHLINNLKIKNANVFRMPDRYINGINCDYTSYKISVPESAFSIALDKELWPKGLLVQPFEWRAPKKHPFRWVHANIPTT